MTDVVLSRLKEKFAFLAAVFFDMDEDPSVQALQPIADECLQAGIAIVKISDDDEARYSCQKPR